jgi:hypothetical protein
MLSIHQQIQCLKLITGVVMGITICIWANISRSMEDEHIHKICNDIYIKKCQR